MKELCSFRFKRLTERLPLFLSYNESYLVYTTGIGEDVILDYIDIINNKKDAPDSFQNAVKIN